MAFAQLETISSIDFMVLSTEYCINFYWNIVVNKYFCLYAFFFIVFNVL